MKGRTLVVRFILEVARIKMMRKISLGRAKSYARLLRLMRSVCGQAFRRTGHSGQLLVEILIGLAVITVALVISLTAVTHATKVSRVARNRLDATKFAEKVTESYRNTRDLNKQTFFQSQICNNPCGTFGDNGMYSCTMTCVFTPGGAPTRVNVTVTMSWNDSGKTVSISLPTVLTKYDL